MTLTAAPYHGEQVVDREHAADANERADGAEPTALELRVRALEHEVAQRTELEAALRDALQREQRARAAAERACEEAERAVRFNELFARMLGHDLRNPLGAISMGATYISRASTHEKITRSAGRILSSTDRMARMVEQLLEFSRLRAGGETPLRLERADLREVCARVKEELEAAHPERAGAGIMIEVEGDAVGVWDAEGLVRVLSTMADNAIAHGAQGAAGAGAAAIHIDGRDADRVEVTVHNAGEIAADKRDVLFEPIRGTSRQHHTRGLGLGLFLAQQVILAHGGTIEVTSSAADGTTMRISLPRAATEAKAAAGATVAAPERPVP